MIDVPQPTQEHDPWEDCTWEGSERASKRRWESLSPAQKQKCIEDARELAMLFQKEHQKMGIKTVNADGWFED